MSRFVINGYFLTQQITGIQRYAIEITRELDSLIDNGEITIITPKYYDGKAVQYKNLKIVKYGNMKGLLWEQIDLHHYLRKSKCVCINFCNVCPLGVRPGITAIHDLMYKMYKNDKASLKIKLSRIWHTFLSDYAIKHEKYIITPSLFSQSEIKKYYPNEPDKIKVVPSGGWEHVMRITPSKDWYRRFPKLKSKEYYFSLSTRSKNKNGEWVIKAAKKNPQLTFAIAGRSYESEGVMPSNIQMLGYVSDNDICSLMKNCKAFIFPSSYEGFGLPPMEALALGADIIVSDIPVMREVYGECAYYIDPNSAEVILDSMIKDNDAKKAEKTSVLKKYSWKISADKLYKLVKES